MADLGETRPVRVRCQYCGSGVEVDRPVGAQPCESCGVTVVWPETEGAEAIDPERARVVAARRGLRYLTLPGTLRSIWTETSGAEPYCRAGYNIERRDVVLRLSPGQGTRASDVVIVPDASREDPWRDDPAGLVQRSASVCVCPSCMGSKKTTCPTCDGQSRVRCKGCGGSGQVIGQRGLKNCPSCRGKGNVKCPQCRSGKVACAQCGASGRVRAWLEVVASQSAQVVVDPRAEGASVHRGLDDVADFERPPDQYENVVVADTGWTAPHRYQIPPRVEPTLDPRRDRISASAARDTCADDLWGIMRRSGLR